MAKPKAYNVTLLDVGEMPEFASEEVIARLKQNAFKEPVLPEPLTSGWVGFDDVNDINLEAAPILRGEYAFFALRSDTRKIPQALLKKELEILVKKELKDTGKSFLPRLRRADLTSQVKDKLFKQTYPIPKLINAIWALSAQKIYFFSCGKNDLEVFCNHFGATFDTLPQDSIQEELGNINLSEFLAWLWYNGDTGPGQIDNEHGIRVGLSISMSDPDDSGQVNTKNKLVEAKYALNRGLNIQAMAIELFGNENLFFWKFQIKGALNRLYALKIPATDSSQDDDPDAIWYEHIFLIDKAFAAIEKAYELANHHYPTQKKQIQHWLHDFSPGVGEILS